MTPDYQPNPIPELRSEEVQEILTQVPSSLLLWSNTIFALMFILLIGISFWVRYPDIISAQAVLTTLEPVQKEFAQTTGKLEVLLVKDHEQVTENQVLAVIENSARYTDVLLLQSIMDTLPINYSDFKFPMEHLPPLFLGELETDFAFFENAYTQYELNKKLQPYSHEMLANKFSLHELRIQLSNLEGQKTIEAKEMLLKQKDLERQKTLFDNGIISAQEYESKQMAYLQSERSFQNRISSISQTREAIGMAQKNTKGNEINRTREDVVLLKNVIQSYHQLKERIKDWELRYVLKSDLAGNVTFLKVWHAHQRVQEGDLVCSIVPTTAATYLAKLKTPALNSGKIKSGQTVLLKLDNYPETEFGTLQGNIQNISLTPDSEGYYWIDVSLPGRLITSYHKEINMQQEMTGTAEIITEDLRLIERFFYGFKKLLRP